MIGERFQFRLQKSQDYEGVIRKYFTCQGWFTNYLNKISACFYTPSPFPMWSFLRNKSYRVMGTFWDSAFSCSHSLLLVCELPLTMTAYLTTHMYFLHIFACQLSKYFQYLLTYVTNYKILQSPNQLLMISNDFT